MTYHDPMDEHPIDAIIRTSNATPQPERRTLAHGTRDRDGYIAIGRFKIAYRGWNMRPFIRRHPIRIGRTRLYTIGPAAIFISPRRTP